MPIPDFQSVMLPLLKFCADGQEYTNRQAIDALSQEFGLTEDEQKELLPSGLQRAENGNTNNLMRADTGCCPCCPQSC